MSSADPPADVRGTDLTAWPEELLDAMSESCREGVVVLGPDARIRYAGRTGRERFGWTDARAGDELAALFTPETASSIAGALDRCRLLRADTAPTEISGYAAGCA
ncbi:MAG: hypothetical protein JOY70_02205, partial [Acidisphaera sp.]|nr:hypothetical protein [Acidisphaera sp.]